MLHCTVAYIQGGATFTVWEAPPLVACAVACTPEAEEELWPELAAAYDEQWSGVPSTKPARRPRRLPWLAVHLLPPVFAAQPEIVSLLGDLERCVAWAIIEAERAPGKPRPVPKLLKQTGEVLPIQPANGRRFTLPELRACVGGPIQVITPPGRTGAILVINGNGKCSPGALKNRLASDIWQQFADPVSSRARDDVVGDVVLCHTSQVL